MKALTWNGKNDIRCETVPDPKIEHDGDAIVKFTACAICGSDLHLFDGIMPSMEKGDALGYEKTWLIDGRPPSHVHSAVPLI